MKRKVLCAGLAVCDVPLRPIPKTILEEDICFIENPAVSTGGDALNVAVTLTKLGVPAVLSGLVGRDANGDFIMKRLDELGVDTGGMVRHPSLGTVVSYILIEPGGERHFALSDELTSVFDYPDIPSRLIDQADMVYFGSAMCMKAMDRGGAAALFRRARGLGKTTFADTSCGNSALGASYWRELLDPMLRETDVFMPSYDEAVILTGQGELSGIRDSLAPFRLKLLVVKLGAGGCYITDFRDEWTIPAFAEFRPVDTTGAGDSFVGGFIRGLLEGWPPRAAGIFANVVAGFNVTKLGATGGVPGFDAALRYAREHAGGGDFAQGSAE
ncbi:MAG: carbohydrate kinase family protein [Treponema sp.]|jgi:sugar/nucleoside kinase (ribokinase family)|nr:carbohydrate kinase family protein [Treponema sp.]